MKVSMTRTLVRVHGKFCRRLGSMPLSHDVSLSQLHFSLVINLINNPVLAYPNAVKPFVPVKFPNTSRKRIFAPILGV